MLSNIKQTPMMTQFYEIKKQFPDSLLFFRMGDFYEMFGEDAQKAAGILGITLTARNKSSENQIPMCGVPHHSYKQYLMKLITAGYKVAICEQLEDPSIAKGLVKRGVVRVVSKGTVLDEEEVAGIENNFLVAVYQDNEGYFYVSSVDVSTGEVFAAGGENIKEILAGFSPKEVICSAPMELEQDVPVIIRSSKSMAKAERYISAYYNINSIENLGLKEPKVLIPMVMAFEYVKDSMLDIIFSRPVELAQEEHLVLDKIALRTLDIFDSGESRGHSLYSVLNHTVTPMGARMLRWWLSHPSRNADIINRRLSIVGYFKEEWGFTQELINLMSNIYDIERITNRVASKRVSPKELLYLKTSLEQLPYIGDMLESTGFNNITVLGSDLNKCINIINLIDSSIKPEPAQNIKEGGIIKDGYNSLVDELRDIQLNGRQMLASMEARLKSETGINLLKVSYNKVFGYYIEVTKSNLGKVPAYFERKQTLVGAERFVTPELKELESKILNSEERLSGLEYELFSSVRELIAESVDILRKIAKDVALVDCYISLAKVANINNYCKPEISSNGDINILDSRHPTVEANLKDLYIANDIYLNNIDSRMLLITGPNMAGKSTYIRSVAIIVLMAHIGSFVPASKAEISLVDRIFTRVGASDNISKGESTFMVEMVETANILTHATSSSLIILDEIGRGTSTFDGVSIAWAVSEYILNRVKAKTLFATHYHELTDIAQENGAKNYTISVKEQDGEIIFLRKIIEGAADKSYGIYVAKLAGIPSAVTGRAEEILKELENGHISGSSSGAKVASEIIVRPMLIFDEEHPALKKLESVDVNAITPVQALQIICDMKSLL